MPAHPTGPAWWRQPGEGTTVPAVADGFVRVLQCHAVGNADPGSSVAYMDIGQAEAHLVLLLLELAKGAPRLASESYPEYVRDRAEWISQRVESVSGQSPSGHILEQTFRGILHALIWRFASSPSGFALDVATGFLPLPPLRDAVVPVPGHERSYVVALNHQAFNFANLQGKAWAQMLPLASDGGARRLDLERTDWLSSVTLDAVGVRRYLDVMLATEKGRPSDAAQYWPRGEFVGLAVCIRDAMEHFLVGRGLAHVVLGHVGSAPTGVAPVFGLPLRVFEFSPQAGARGGRTGYPVDPGVRPVPRRRRHRRMGGGSSPSVSRVLAELARRRAGQSRQ